MTTNDYLDYLKDGSLHFVLQHIPDPHGLLHFVLQQIPRPAPSNDYPTTPLTTPLTTPPNMLQHACNKP